MWNINNVIEFTRFLNQFRAVKRTIYVPWEDRMENDAEHSFQLAMLAWYFIEVFDLELDLILVIKYALIHDLVETYAGDVYFYTSSLKELEEKDKREKQAAKQIQENFSEFEEMNNLIQSYEQKENEESKFIYSLDKLLPVINIYLDEWRTFREFNVSLDVLFELKDMKISESQKVHEVWKELVELMKKRQDKLF